MKAQNWLLRGVFAASLAGLPAGFTAVARADREEPVRVEDLRRPIREVIDGEAGRRGRLVELNYVLRDNAEFYRAVMQYPDGDYKILRIAPNGRLLEKDFGEGERRWEDRWRGEHRRPADVRRDDVRRDDPRDDERLRHDLEGRAIERDAVTHRAWRAIEREGGGGHIESIREVNFRGMTLYRAEIRGRGPDRIIFVSPDGTYYGDRDEVFGGLREIDLHDIPREVRETVRREGDEGDVRHVFTSRRGGQRYYTVVIENRRGTNWVTCDETGRLMSVADR